MNRPRGWTRYRLGEALELLIDHRGKTPRKLGGDWTSDGIPVVSAIHVKDGRIDWSQRVRFVSTDIFERWMSQRVRAGDVLLTSEAPLGSVAQAPDDRPLVISQRLFVLRGKSDLMDQRFLRHWLTSPDAQVQLRSRSSGSTVTGIRQAELRRIELRLPPLSEQRHIVEILEDHLSRLDAAELELALASARSDRWALSALWKITHVASAPLARLDSIAEVKLGRQRSPRNHSGARMRPYLRAANVHWNRLRLDDIKEMNFSETEEATFALRRGDILVVEASGSAAEVGKSAIFADEVAGACFQNTLLRVRCRSSLPGFVQKYLLAEALAGRLVQESRGVGIHHIGRARLAALPIMVPDEAEQARIAEGADTVLAAAERVRDEIDAAHSQGRALRQALLEAAFTGRLTGRSSDEEVVQELAGV